MYKPPENTNRVKTIKSKFENNENVNTQLFSDRKPPATLSRQLSDPVKVNIKRSPAFRNDKVLQRNGAQISVKLNKNKSLTNNKNCDNVKAPVTTASFEKTSSFNSLRKRFDSQENLMKISNIHMLKERSNTSEEIVFNRKLISPKPKEELKYENLSILYTEPIPKSQRVKEPNIHNTSTLKISDSPKKQIEDEYIHKLNILTDTLKLALKKPLPSGPAPKKPPRTFQHSPQSHKSKEDFAQQLNDNLQKSLDNQKKSPKYMLDKLENALKNNKIRLKRQPKVDYASESDESFESKSSVTKFNLNCLQSLGCSNATYEAINQPNAQFFDSYEEPVYAEPFVFPVKENDEKEKNEKKFNRNSLYYMSTPVTPTDGIFAMDNMDDQNLNNSDVGDTSSLSTPGTSDIDSLTSTPSEENKPFTSPKIRDLIRNFESRKMESVDSRVDHLERQMKKALDVSFDPPNKEENVSERSSLDGESSDKIAGKFATYVKSIRLCTKARMKNDGKVLFQCCMLVGLNGKEPYVKFQFPKTAELPYKIEELCFPDSRDSTIDCSLKAQNYSIVITNNEGERIYGYCRRVLPEDSTTCLPLAYCILSKHRAPRFYRRILQELESRHGIPDKIRDIFLNEIYYTKFPTPGESVKFNMVEVNKYIMENTLDDKLANGLQRVSNDSALADYEVIGCGEGYGSINNGTNYNKRNAVLFKNGIIPKEIWDDGTESSSTNPSTLIIPLDHDARHKENDLEELCNTLNVNILIKVFASLLLERKVIFISCVLGKLSMCIEAIQNMLYPFTWPHTLIPVVPKELWEIVEAPTPLICGTLSLAVVNDYNIEDGIVVDLDERAIILEVGDENKILPSCLQKELKDGMQLAKRSESEGAYNVLLSDAFLRIFILLCGHYKDSIKDGNFQKEEFINFHKSKSKKRFLKWFTETTMFYTFIDSVLADKNVFKIFDKRIQIYGSQDAKLILEKMKDWKKDKSNTLGIF